MNQNVLQNGPFTGTRRLLDKVWTMRGIITDDKIQILSYSNEDPEGYAREKELPKVAVEESHDRVILDVYVDLHEHSWKCIPLKVSNPSNVYNYSDIDLAIELQQAWGKTKTEPAPAEKHFLLIIYGDVDPDRKGPYKSFEETVEAAREYREHDNYDDGLFHMTVDEEGFPDVSAFTGGILNQDLEETAHQSWAPGD